MNENLQRVFLEETLEGVLELLEALKIGCIPNRDELCYCGSGKKYKKCCEVRDRITASPLAKVEMSINDNVVTMLRADGEMLSEKDETRFLKCLDKLDVDRVDNGLVNTLEVLAKRYHNPFVWENLIIAYEEMGRLAECEAIIIQEKFPDYLFSKIHRAFRAMDEGHPGLVPEIFDGHQCLPLLYPHRHEFHEIEAYLFHELWLLYNYEIDDLRQAEMHFAIVQLVGAQESSFAKNKEIIEELRLKRRLKIALNRLDDSDDNFTQTAG